jgi:hypothetical protein
MAMSPATPIFFLLFANDNAGAGKVASHGTKEGRIILEDKLGSPTPVPQKALARVFEILQDNIRCVILNACFWRRGGS